MKEWNLYIDKWALVKNINLDLVKEFKIVFLDFLYKNSIETSLRENFQLILLENIDKFEKETFSLIINFVIWFYKETNINLNKFQIDNLINKTKGISFTKGKRSDPFFEWALHYDITLYLWTTFFSTYLELKKNSYNLYRQAFINFLDYLIYYPNIARDPFLYLSINYDIPEEFKKYAINIKKLPENNTGLRNSLSKLCDFFDWFLIVNCTYDNNHQIIDTNYKNPIEKISIKNKNYTETYRNALPSRYLRILEEIITEDDYKWPKTLKNEWIIHNNERIWSPVTTYLILLKLKTPIRTYQLRYLDSGEGDKFYFDYDTWNWKINSNAIYKYQKDYKGVLRKIIDNNTQNELVGLYINTNKTKDSNSDLKGYTIPWENKEVIEIISDLMKWQKRYNPVTKPYKWVDIKDIQLTKRSKEVLKERGENFFLFRDKSNENPEEPILDSRVQYYWKVLLAELERRINKERELSNDKPILFIEKWQGTKPLVSYYDLHSLRVTNLTALHQAGVPYTILSKYLAGHSTILMTMYYTKYNQTHISETLNKATMDISLKEQENFNNYIANARYERLEENLVYNNINALESISQLNIKSCSTSDIGICPVGENKCSEGGEFLGSAGGSGLIYNSVENGPKNCIRCRFFITGVPFLLGLISKFNELAINIKEKTNIYKKSEMKYENLFNEKYNCEKENKPFLKWKDLEIADSHYHKHNNELDQLLLDWQFLYNLIEQCKIIQEKKMKENFKLNLLENSDKFDLITNRSIMDLNYNITECSEFELYDEVCQSSIFYESIQPNIANMKRNQIINKMLLNNDIEPYFLFLNEDESLYIGNEFIKLLMIKLGKPNTIDVLNDKKKLFKSRYKK
ncbi:VPA1269 family protein [Aliarcobacter butzleri]|uniref:VPA1269 family protein n=1 Tax=Aliarcobacter butzleri TaxID=28197 RepID=A0AAW7Q5W9_9BACT|nr:VPA1269 family protein [Aliarcobacter butzleri]MDN5114884.1 VPA1269 family protein [Aliarcobacter butzleri]